MWSVLLYSAVEAQEFWRCEELISKLLESGIPTGTDFVNMVRYHVSYRCDPRVMYQFCEDLHAKGFRLDCISRNRALSACSSNKALYLAEILSEDKFGEASMDTVGYNTLMKGYAQAGEPARCFDLYEKMKIVDQAPSEITFGILLDACIDAKEFERAKHVFRDLKNSGVTMNVVHYTTFMKGLANAGELADATEVLQEMLRSRHIKPDLVTYSTIVKAYSDHGQVMDAINVLKQMLDQAIFPDAIIFNIVLTGCCVNAMEPTQIFQIFQRLRKFGLKTSTTTLSIMIKALALTKSWGLALDMLETSPERLNLLPEARLYAQLAQACVKAGHSAQALETYAAMVRAAGRHGSAVDEESNSRLCRLCASCGKSFRATKISQAVARAGGFLNIETLDELLNQQSEVTCWRSQMVACA
jgi:pentatricopeptide repeat protein